jgi:hypothetical protein
MVSLGGKRPECKDLHDEALDTRVGSFGINAYPQAARKAAHQRPAWRIVLDIVVS